MGFLNKTMKKRWGFAKRLGAKPSKSVNRQHNLPKNEFYKKLM